MNSEAPISKVEMIERSLRCFQFGLLSLIPILGIPFAIVALAEYGRIKRRRGATWNPAKKQLFWGTQCARLTFWPTFILGILYVSAHLMGYDHGKLFD
jgi:hypothetical protein